MPCHRKNRESINSNMLVLYHNSLLLSKQNLEGVNFIGEVPNTLINSILWPRN